MQLRDYTFLGATQSLCPECLALVPAKIVCRDERVYFRKRCPRHGEREDFVCSDVRWYDRMEYSLPGKIPETMGVEPAEGCPYDCGLCSEHEQHTCVGVLEITSSCNLTCPMCYAGSAPGGRHLSLADCRRAIDRLVEVEGRPEILQLSGGEPTIHPEFLEIFEYACEQPIDIVMINTNGIRLARVPAFLEAVARWRHRTEIYFQLDGLAEGIHETLRGEPLLDVKLEAIERLGEAQLRVNLVATLQPNVNDDQMGPLVEFAAARPWITGISFQPATYAGRYVLPDELERRITFPDVIRGVAEQSREMFTANDFIPLPCAHPNGHTLAYAYRGGGAFVPINRLLDIENHLDLLANGITFNRPRAKALIAEFLARQCCGGNCDAPKTENARSAALPVIDSNGRSAPAGDGEEPSAKHVQLADEFFQRALAEDLAPADVLRITITSFMDAYNFDIRQLMKSCVHHVLPSGHLIPFSAYNVLYRDGHVPLPPLRQRRAAVSS